MQAGEFATAEGDDLDDIDPGTRAAGSVMALAAFATGGFWGNSLPRRFRPIAWQGMLISMAVLTVATIVLAVVLLLLFDPPRG